MRCPSCNKFATYDTSSEPEIELSVEAELIPATEEGKEDNPDKAIAHITGDVRIVLTGECCGEELKEAHFEVDEQVEIERAEGCTCDLTDLDVEGSGEISDRQDSQVIKTKKDGTQVTKAIPPRFRKTYYGADMQIIVSCTCGKTTETKEWHDECQASGMDELV